MLNKLGALILEGVQVIAISVIMIVILHVYAFQPQQVKGYSMYPYLDDGDHLITEKITYRFRKPERGEIVVFQFPLNKTQEYIKRIIGLPGEKLEVKDGKVIIYNTEHPEGFVLEEDYLKPDVVTAGKAFIHDGEIIEVPQGKYLVFGDNREQSSDSRQWGFIEQKDITGRAVLRYWPPETFGTVGN